jgi:outer membrane protein insertion porin family
MSCVSNLRRASDRLALVVALVVAFALACVRPAAAVQVRFAPDVAAGAEARRFLAADVTWLEQQPAGQLVAPVDAGPDSALTWLRRHRGPRAEVAEPAIGRRDLLSLLRDRWQERGHLTATVVLVDGVVLVDPGPVYRLGQLEVGGSDFPDRARLLATLMPRTGDRFRPVALEEAVTLLLRAVGERGFPFPAWEVHDLTLRPEAGEVDISAGLFPGRPAVVGPQYATLPAGRGERFLVRSAGLETGRPFRESDLVRGVERLVARNLYAEVADPELYLAGGPDTVGVVWRVTETPRQNRLAVMLGLSRREAQGGSRLSGAVDLRLPNLAGRGRAFTLGWNDDGAQRSHFGFSYLEPLAFGTPLDVQGTLDSEVQRDAYTRLRLDGVLRLPVVSLWWVELGVGWDRTTYPASDVARTTRRRLRGALGHRRGDEGRSGWSALFALESAQRATSLRAEAAPTQLGQDASQKLIESDLGGEIWLNPTLSLSGRTSLRQIESDAQPVPLSEQYRFGGATTVRGYREDEFHGETVVYGGAELRLGRVHRSRVYTFLDSGYFSFAGTSGRATGYGLGIMARSGLGEINLAVGFPGTVEFTTAKLHVSLLGTF